MIRNAEDQLQLLAQGKHFTLQHGRQVVRPNKHPRKTFHVTTWKTGCKTK